MELYVNGDKHVLEVVDPAMTLLRYLRTVAKLKGTKEGCASGDCGACTVLVAKGQQMQSVNSCIALLGSFANQQLYTVEGLANAETGELHPVQKAMVDCHGSQCGFCTPGFVMSLAGLYSNSAENSESDQSGQGVQPQNEQIFDCISGNLCRCTGYRPIVEAAQQMLEYQPQTPIKVAKSDSSNRVHYFDAGTAVAKTLATTEPSQLPQYHLPRSEAQLQALLASDASAFLVAGGTDKVLEITQNYATPQVVIDLTQVEELVAIEQTETFLDIGGAATYSHIEPVLGDYSPELIAILHRLGSRQIRNRGTLGGNIANGSPIADTPPVLLVWQAQLETVNSSDERKWLDINDFYTGYRQTLLEAGAYIAKIRIGKDEMARPHRFYKVSKRFEDDISAVMGAFVVEHQLGQCSLIRIAYGGMAATPVRALKTEEFLVGKKLTQANLDQACNILAQEFTPLSDVRASAGYRREIALNLLRKAICELTELELMLPAHENASGASQHA